MLPAHFYVYSDACPTDWLENGHEARWHTIVNFAFQSDPVLQPLIDVGKLPHEALGSDNHFSEFLIELQSKLSSNQLRKWKTGPSYRNKFCNSFLSAFDKFRPIVNAYSFQEQTLRIAKQTLLGKYNELIGGIEGRGIGFEESIDSKNHVRMKHSFINFFGYHEIAGLENQILPLLFLCYFIADQYIFYRADILRQRELGFDSLKFTVVSDKLSGDDNNRHFMQENLRNLIDPEGISNPIVLMRSPKSDFYPGDLIVDNLAGWLNAAISDPSSEFAKTAKHLVSEYSWNGWKELLPVTTELSSRPAILRITTDASVEPL